MNLSSFLKSLGVLCISSQGVTCSLSQMLRVYNCLLSSLKALEEELNTDCTSHMSMAGVGEGHYCVARFPLDTR